MLRLGVVAALIGCCGLSPAMGQAVPDTPLSSAPPVPASGRLLQPLVPGGSIEHSARLGGNVRLRVSVRAVGQGTRDRLHQRVASSMVEFYPVGDSGFHLSAGTRLHDTVAGAKAANRGLIGSPRGLGAPGSRMGLKRTPALTMGYSGTAADGTTIGLEVGAMKGRAYTDANAIARRARAERIGGNPVNPMVNLVVSRRF